MKHISEISKEEAGGLRALLFDLDDTLLDHGSLSEAAYSALFRLRESGLVLVAVTGRPSSWAEIIVRQWPIEGAVAESGAFACGLVDRRLVRYDEGDADAENRRIRLSEIVMNVRALFPELRPTDDVGGRRTDFTFDIGEHEHVDAAVVARVCATARALGARTTVSSVHLHVTLEGPDKASGAIAFLSRRLGWDPTEAVARAAFIGDSDNDEACFNAFRTTIAVANFRGRPTLAPRFSTHEPMGAGFAEAARAIVSRRNRGGNPSVAKGQ
jgi:HAD superfamily hydrolase (TIGR01484 family)